MNIILLSLVFPSLQAVATGLETGDEVSVEALGKAYFIQGEAPDKWEAGKLYVMECWATWCAPCVAAIPHLDALYDEYHEMGLVVIGMNVREDGKDRVAKFVENEGERMSYPVAYVGNSGAFAEVWLKGVRSIPHTFVVKDGKLLFATHPVRLTARVIEGLLEGGEEEEAIVARMRNAADVKEAMHEPMRAFSEAKEGRNVAAMKAAIAEVRKLDPDSPFLGWLRIEVAFVKKDWGAVKGLLEAELDRAPQFTVSRIVRLIVPRILMEFEEEEVSPGLLGFLAEQIGKHKGDPAGVNLWIAFLQMKAGNKKEALAAAQAALEEVKKLGSLPVEPFEALVRGIEDRESLTFRGFMNAMPGAEKKAKEDDSAH